MFLLLTEVPPPQTLAARPAPPAVIWTYDTPTGFQLLEPGYRFPTQIKQALVQFVQPDADLSRAYQDVFADKKRFTAWFKGLLQDQNCLLYTSPSPRDRTRSRMPSSA